MERRTGGEEGMEIQRGQKGWRYRERKGWREGQKGREEGMEEWGDGRGRDGGMERGTERQEGIAYRNQSFLWEMGEEGMEEWREGQRDKKE